MRAKALPAKLIVPKIRTLPHAFAVGLKITNIMAIAGLTGLTSRISSFTPAISIAPKYDPARMMV